MRPIALFLLLTACGEVLDEEPPETQITAGPGEAARELVATIEFVSSEPDSTFLCHVDTASPVGCTSPYVTATLSEGDHTFEVQAIDAEGNVDLSPARYVWIIDVAAPAINITDGPATGVATPDPTPTFAFTTDGATEVVCHVDDGPRTPCITNYTTVPLTDGNHEFEVVATDDVGNTAAASRSFTVRQP